MEISSQIIILIIGFVIGGIAFSIFRVGSNCSNTKKMRKFGPNKSGRRALLYLLLPDRHGPRTIHIFQSFQYLVR